MKKIEGKTSKKLSKVVGGLEGKKSLGTESLSLGIAVWTVGAVRLLQREVFQGWIEATDSSASRIGMLQLNIDKPHNLKPSPPVFAFSPHHGSASQHASGLDHDKSASYDGHKTGLSGTKPREYHSFDYQPGSMTRVKWLIAEPTPVE